MVIETTLQFYLTLSVNCKIRLILVFKGHGQIKSKALNTCISLQNHCELRLKYKKNKFHFIRYLFQYDPRN